MVAVTPLWHRSGPLHPVPLITHGRETDRPPILHIWGKIEGPGNLSTPTTKTAWRFNWKVRKILTGKERVDSQFFNQLFFQMAPEVYIASKVTLWKFTFQDVPRPSGKRSSVSESVIVWTRCHSTWLKHSQLSTNSFKNRLDKFWSDMGAARVSCSCSAHHHQVSNK